ncbi:MAG: hypothetical protein AAFQ04_11075, partial [Pseudomonadota bacterium]
MMRFIAIGCVALGLSSCGESPSASPDEAVADSAAATIDPALLALWGGSWSVNDPETGQRIATIEIREDAGRWRGQVSLTENFCQTEKPEARSYCPVETFGTSLSDIDANQVALVASGQDPFRDDFSNTFALTM